MSDRYTLTLKYFPSSSSAFSTTLNVRLFSIKHNMSSSEYGIKTHTDESCTCVVIRSNGIDNSLKKITPLDIINKDYIVSKLFLWAHRDLNPECMIMSHLV